jgi:queuine/archaeosine tRNA-ribosyltransferase
MDNVVQQMEQQKEQMNRSRQRLNDAKAEYDANCNTLLLMYIQQTGQYPE